MAGDWMKMRTNLWDDPRVGRLCDYTEATEAAVIGGLYWLWATADEHTTDGFLAGMSLRQIDRKTGIPKFGAGLVAIGWITEKDGGIVIERFEEHNGRGAKARAQNARRQSIHKDSSKSGNGQVTDPALPKGETGNGGSVTETTGQRDLEREREEEKKNTLSLSHAIEKLPTELHAPFQRWLEVHRFKTGQAMSEIQLDAVVMDLLRRGDRALADIEFSITKGSKNLLDSSNDYQKRNPPGTSGGGRATKGERIKQEAGF